jgi:hypothetical protein
MAEITHARCTIRIDSFLDVANRLISVISSVVNVRSFTAFLISGAV